MTETGGLSVFIEPKSGIAQLLSLACYAIGRIRFRPQDFSFPEEYALSDVLSMALSTRARRAYSSGLLHGYRAEEEPLIAAWGRIRLEEPLRRRFDTDPPVELQYDEFTNDMLPNRLVKAAAHRLGRIRLRSPEARQSQGRVAGILDGISLVEFAPARVPTVALDRLTVHYRDVISLARFILLTVSRCGPWGRYVSMTPAGKHRHRGVGRHAGAGAVSDHDHLDPVRIRW